MRNNYNFFLISPAIKKLFLKKISNIQILIICLCLFNLNKINAQQQTFLSTSSSSPTTYTWICPQGVTSVSVQAWGGGEALLEAAFLVAAPTAADTGK